MQVWLYYGLSALADCALSAKSVSNVPAICRLLAIELNGYFTLESEAILSCQFHKYFVKIRQISAALSVSFEYCRKAILSTATISAWKRILK